jgi:Flp pilus assembly pilin Flp
METLVPKTISTRRSRKTGAVMVEYVFLLIFICMVALIGIKTFGGTVANKMGSNNNSVTNAIQ